MATPTTVESLAEISTYLWATKLAKNAAFGNGNSNINNGRDLVLFIENAALSWGVEQSLDGVQGVANDVYRLCGAELQKANEILESGSSGGIIVNPSTGVVDITYYEAVFTVGDVNAPILDGESSYTVNIGLGKSFDAKSAVVTKDQSFLPRGTILGYSTFDANYSTSSGLVTISFSDAVANGQLYTIQFPYITL